MARSIEGRVAQHYSHGSLERAIEQALAAVGVDLARLTPADLAPVDEFHIGGRQATIDFADQLEIKPGMHLLDVGCGLGGASRYFAHERRCRVTGVDLSVEYLNVAARLAQRLGLTDITYRQASALDLPFPPGSFDGAYMLHVGMNIENKAALFAQVRRVLKPDAVFGIYDIMREGEGELAFPVAWASTRDTSFVDDAATYKSLLTGTGFEIRKERSRRDLAIAFYSQLRARLSQHGEPPALGLHLLMGPTSSQKVENMMAGVQQGIIGPTEIVCRAAVPQVNVS